MTYSVLACEGPQDQAALSWLARICAGWEPRAYEDVPDDIGGLFEPQAAGGPRIGAKHGRQRPTYLAKGRDLLIVREFGGKEGLLATHTATFLKKETEAAAIGVVVDADALGVAKRVESFRTTYGPAFPHAANVKVGTVWGDEPQLGFWVAPDNQSQGRMDDALVIAARRSRKGLIEAGEAFISSSEEAAPGKWTETRSKALLGSVYQVEAPGASLASALERGKCWFDKSIVQIEPFGKLVKFIDAVGTGHPWSGRG